MRSFCQVSSNMHGSLMCYLFLLPLLGFIIRGNNNEPFVTTSQGTIQGIWKTTINERQIEAFLGIPYAKPPVGPLRFENPQPSDSWNGVRDGTKEPPLCIQVELFSKDVHSVGSEDCLYLNVYTPSTSTSEKYPVMVFIFGGAYISGGGISDFYGPDMLLDKDVVLVTFNHRVGILGFASTEDEEMPGNYGLKDQLLALKWIKNNIGNFGGKSNVITIFGESSGASSVHFHMLSPLSKGLFQRSILMSGSAYCPWSISPHGYVAEETKRLGSLANCTFSSSKQLVNCLRNTTAELFVYALFEYVVWAGFDPMIVFKPVFEPEDSEGAFITKENYLNHSSDVEMMAGITSEEGAFKVAILYASKQFDAVLSQLDSEWLKLAPYTMFYYDSATDINNVSMTIRDHYLNGKPIDRNSVPQLVKMFSDSWFGHCTLSAIKRHKGTSYAYKFAHKGDNSITFLMTNSTFNYGVCHADDLIYLFPMKNWLARHFGFSEKDKAVSEQMVNMYTNFATYGNPTVDGEPVKWKPYTDSDREYIIIQGENYRMEKDFLTENDDLWSNLTWRNKIFEDAKNDNK